MGDHLPSNTNEPDDGGCDSGSWKWRPNAIHTPTTQHSTFEARLEANLQKRSVFLQCWNHRHLKIFGDRIEYGFVSKDGVFTQKHGYKSPIYMQKGLISYVGFGDTDFVLKVREGKNKSIKERMFRCASASDQRTLLAVLDEISKAAQSAKAQLADAVIQRGSKRLQQALDASAPYGIDSREEAVRLMPLALMEEAPGREAQGEFHVLESSVFRRRSAPTADASSPLPQVTPATPSLPPRVLPEVANGGSSESANQKTRPHQSQQVVPSFTVPERPSWVNAEAPIVEEGPPQKLQVGHLDKNSKSRSQGSGSFGALSVEIPFVPLEQRARPTEHESGSGGGRSLISQLPPLLPKRHSPTIDAGSSVNSPSNRADANHTNGRYVTASSPEHFQEASSQRVDVLRGARGAASTNENDDGLDPKKVNNGNACASVSRREEATEVVPCSSFRVDIRAAAFGMCRCGATQAAHSIEARQNDWVDHDTGKRNEIKEKVNTFQTYIARTSNDSSCSARPYKPVGHRLEPQEEPKET